jgi:hypothetical protein
VKNFPDTRQSIENDAIVSNVENILHAEWNLNRYIGNPTLRVIDDLPSSNATEDIREESAQITKAFPIESVVKSNRGTLSAYVINETRYKVRPKYEKQRARSESSWNNDTTWLWYDQNQKYEYWTSFYGNYIK